MEEGEEKEREREEDIRGGEREMEEGEEKERHK